MGLVANYQLLNLLFVESLSLFLLSVGTCLLEKHLLLLYFGFLGKDGL